MKKIFFTHKNIVVLSCLESSLKEKFKNLDIEFFKTNKMIKISTTEEMVSEILLSIPMTISLNDLKIEVKDSQTISTTEW